MVGVEFDNQPLARGVLKPMQFLLGIRRRLNIVKDHGGHSTCLVVRHLYIRVRGKVVLRCRTLSSLHNSDIIHNCLEPAIFNL